MFFLLYMYLEKITRTLRAPKINIFLIFKIFKMKSYLYVLRMAYAYKRTLCIRPSRLQ